MVLGFLIAAKNAIDARQKSRQVRKATITRARVTNVASQETSTG
jgi:hypothetical protein